MDKHKHLTGGTIAALLALVLAVTAAPDKPWKVRTTAIGRFFDAESDALDLHINFKYLNVAADVDTDLGDNELEIGAFAVGAGIGGRF